MISIVDDDESVRESTKALVRSLGYAARLAPTFTAQGLRLALVELAFEHFRKKGHQIAALACWALHTLMKDGLSIDTLDEIEAWLAGQ